MRATGRGDQCWTSAGLYVDCNWTVVGLLLDCCWIAGGDRVGSNGSDDTGWRRRRRRERGDGRGRGKRKRGRGKTAEGCCREEYIERGGGRRRHYPRASIQADGGVSVSVPTLAAYAVVHGDVHLCIQVQSEKRRERIASLAPSVAPRGAPVYWALRDRRERRKEQQGITPLSQQRWRVIGRTDDVGEGAAVLCGQRSTRAARACLLTSGVWRLCRHCRAESGSRWWFDWGQWLVSLCRQTAALRWQAGLSGIACRCCYFALFTRSEGHSVGSVETHISLHYMTTPADRSAGACDVYSLLNSSSPFWVLPTSPPHVDHSCTLCSHLTRVSTVGHSIITHRLTHHSHSIGT